jgi:hypothetical protein
VVPMIRS